MRLIGRIALAWAASAALSAAAGFEINGIVVGLKDGEPIHHAKVTLRGWNVADPHITETLVALTDEEGKFSFVDLPQTSQYAVTTEKAGYSPTLRDNFHNLHTNSTLTLHLIRRRVAIVTVRDNAGLPVAGARVWFLGRPDDDIFDVKSPSPPSDQDGVSRSSLLPGRYRMVVFAPGADTLFSARDLTFRPLYYPGTEDPNRADWIDLISGKDFQGELRVMPIRASEIQAHLDFNGRVNQVFVSSTDKNNPNMIWGSVQWKDEARDVHITGLPPGNYLLSFSISVAAFSTFYVKTVEALEEVTHVVVSEGDRR